MNNIAIIPARKNSKRIKNKNLIIFNKKPIILNAIDQAINSKLFSKVIISTDSIKIKNLSIKNCAEVPFLRPKKLSGDFVNTLDVVKHTINYLLKRKIRFDNVCCIYPVTPFLDSSILNKSFNFFKKDSDKFLISVHKSPVVIKRAFNIENKEIKLIKKNNYTKNTQKFNDVYFDAAQFYWGKASKWLSVKKIINNNVNTFEIPYFKSIDIDNKEDLEMARLIYRGIYNTYK
tara:strand:- start:1919 stop:2614 length:696 start_codon:yes stop_codon:yes gene_type:complete